MSVELVRAAALTEAAPYAYAAIVGPGSLVLTAGAVRSTTTVWWWPSVTSPVRPAG
ncbi:MAG: hypothetical protein JWO76_2808 [Nocardioides sp.]|nr:hypothetical protein [Nocardioides sp.]